jgi:hypothetical protein
LLASGVSKLALCLKILLKSEKLVALLKQRLQQKAIYM